MILNFLRILVVLWTAFAQVVPVIAVAESASSVSQAPTSRAESFVYSEQQIAAVIPWLQKSAIPLNGVDPGLPDNDLERLEPIFKNVQIIGVGEATHGTSDFFRFKHRLFEFLVENCGFTVLALESDWFNCELIDDYVRTGAGDPEALLCVSNYPHWRRHEVLNVIKWMRAYNSKLPAISYERRRLKFIGMEHPSSLDVLNKLEATVQPLDPKIIERAKKLTEEYILWVKNRAAHNRQTIRQKLLNKIESMKSLLVSSKPAPRYRKNVEQAVWYLRIFRNSVLLGDCFAFNEFIPASNVRDKAMAETVIETLSKHGPGTKIMVWASNGHVRPQASNYGWVTVGTHLRKVYGAQYYALAQCFLEGSFLAIDQDKQGERPTNIFEWTKFSVAPPKTQTIETLFSKAFVQPFFIDYRQAKGNRQILAWGQQKQPIRQCATGFSKSKEDEFVGLFTPFDFDGMVYIPKMSAAQPLPDAGRMPGVAKASTASAKALDKPESENLVGVGLILVQDEKNNTLRVRGTMPGSDAKAAGVRKGDILIDIDGIAVDASKFDLVPSKIRGPIGTTVTLTFLREQERLTVTLRRAKITLPAQTGDCTNKQDDDDSES